MATYDCQLCGYSYSEANGDPTNSVDPGTPWAELDEDWCCPECGAAKDNFELARTEPPPRAATS